MSIVPIILNEGRSVIAGPMLHEAMQGIQSTRLTNTENVFLKHFTRGQWHIVLNLWDSRWLYKLSKSTKGFGRGGMIGIGMLSFHEKGKKERDRRYTVLTFRVTRRMTPDNASEFMRWLWRSIHISFYFVSLGMTFLIHSFKSASSLCVAAWPTPSYRW